MENPFDTAVRAAIVLFMLCPPAALAEVAGTPVRATGEPAVDTGTSSLVTDEDSAAAVQLVATDPRDTRSLSHWPAMPDMAMPVCGPPARCLLPSPNYSGTDSLSVTVSDNAGGQMTGTTNVTMNPVNDPPALASTQLAVDEQIGRHHPM